MLESLAMGALGSLGGYFGDMLRKKTTMAGAASNVNDAIGALSPQALELQKQGGLNASYSKAGTTGADVSKQFQKQYSQFGNQVGAQEGSALSDIQQSGRNALSNVGKGWELASNQAANANRANARMAKEAMYASGPAGGDAIFSKLGEANANTMTNMYGQGMQQAQAANQMFGDSANKYLSGTIGAKQSNYALNVAPWEMQRDAASMGLLGSTIGQGLNLAADQSAMVGANPLGFLETGGGYSMGQGLNSFFGNNTLKKSEGAANTTTGGGGGQSFADFLKNGIS